MRVPSAGGRWEWATLLVALGGWGLGQEPPLEVTSSQRPSGETFEHFVVTSSREAIRVGHLVAWYPCCLELRALVELDGTALRITETDVAPPCRCPDVPWDLAVEITGLAPGTYDIFLQAEDGSLLATARIPVPERDTELFVRGHVNGDDRINVADAVAVLMLLFRGGEGPRCADAVDVDDNGAPQISDAVFLLRYLFAGGPPPPPPFPDPGEDPTPDSTVCSLGGSLTVASFRRDGDFNGDDVADMSDVALFLGYLWGNRPVPCEDGLDVNDDGVVNLDDLCTSCPVCCGIPGPFFVPPFPPPSECGPDPTPDALGCLAGADRCGSR